MPLNYTTYVAALTDLMITQVDNPDFVTILPDIIDYAEQRIYRELDLLSTRVTNDGSSLTTANRNFAIPGNFVVIEEVNAITPAGTPASNGSRKPLIPVSRNWIDMVWPGNGSTGLPQHFAMVDQSNIIVGPSPDANYTMEIVGTIRPAPISASNPTTFLSTNLPDLFIAASMIFASGFQKNFGSQGDDPKMSVSWESQYQTLFASANNEEWRKKFASSAWSSIQPSPFANPQRK